jgi:hypothetical protein
MRTACRQVADVDRAETKGADYKNRTTYGVLRNVVYGVLRNVVYKFHQSLLQFVNGIRSHDTSLNAILFTPIRKATAFLVPIFIAFTNAQQTALYAAILYRISFKSENKN